jgi:hypothetical protein
MPQIRILNKFEPNPYSGLEIDTTSRGNNKDLSPFYLGPVPTYEPGVMATCVENLYQYSKVYREHTYQPKEPIDLFNPMCWEPSDLYYKWRDDGWRRPRAVRYPMGKGAKPMYSLWRGQKLSYIQARKIIYIPAYANAVIKTRSYAMLYEALKNGSDIVLRDFDGYDYTKTGQTLVNVVNNTKRTMGHAFVLAMLLTGTIEVCLSS